jgi:hypothetical protein
MLRKTKRVSTCRKRFNPALLFFALPPRFLRSRSRICRVTWDIWFAFSSGFSHVFPMRVRLSVFGRFWRLYMRAYSAWFTMANTLGCCWAVSFGSTVRLIRSFDCWTAGLLDCWTAGLLDCWTVKWEALGCFTATEEWFRKNAPNRLNQYFHPGEGGFEKSKTKILKTEIQCEKIKKIEDLPNAPELEEEAEKEDVRPHKERW